MSASVGVEKVAVYIAAVIVPVVAILAVVFGRFWFVEIRGIDRCRNKARKTDCMRYIKKEENRTGSQTEKMKMVYRSGGDNGLKIVQNRFVVFTQAP